MSHLRNLRVQLQERRNRLYKCGHRTYDAELQYLLQFLENNSYIQCLVTALDANDSVDFESWCNGQNHHGGPQFPGSEEGRAKVCYNILKQCVYSPNGDVWFQWGRLFSSENKFDPMLRDLTEAVVDPFVNYLHDRIDEAGNVLYLIERFKQKVEWFQRAELYRQYVENTAIGETNLDQALREGLFDGGVDYPFSQPVSPSGRADVVAQLGSDDPLVLEVKVFDPERGKNNSHLRQGFQQILRYAEDYNQSLGYLVIFNCADQQLVFSSEETAELEIPYRFPYSGKTFFIITIDVHPEVPSASKEKPSNRRVIDVRDLVGL